MRNIKYIKGIMFQMLNILMDFSFTQSFPLDFHSFTITFFFFFSHKTYLEESIRSKTFSLGILSFYKRVCMDICLCLCVCVIGIIKIYISISQVIILLTLKKKIFPWEISFIPYIMNRIIKRP